jgi:hypothetical protein
MRNPDACVGPLPPYELRVWVDEELVIEELVSGRGARGDRPLYVFEDLPLAPGPHDVRVDFERQQGASAGVQNPGNRLSLDAGVVLEPGTVTLVARAGDTGDLEVRRPR